MDRTPRIEKEITVKDGRNTSGCKSLSDKNTEGTNVFPGGCTTICKPDNEFDNASGRTRDTTKQEDRMDFE